MTGLYLGIDIGGTKVSLRVVRESASPDAEVVWHAVTRWPSMPGSAADDFAQLRQLVERLRREIMEPFVGVGVAVAATVTGVGRVQAWPNRPWWQGSDLAGELRALFPESRIAWDDDGALATVAEAAASDATDLIYVGVGTGVGGGIVVRGFPLSRGTRGRPELGHLIVNHDGAPCTCGRKGCLQAESSGPATLRRAGDAFGRAMSFDELRAGWVGGEPWATGAIVHSCTVLAAALVGMGELVRPAVHVVGGGFARGIPGFVDEVGRQAAALSRPGHPVAPVMPARFGAESSLQGALIAARGAHVHPTKEGPT